MVKALPLVLGFALAGLVGALAGSLLFSNERPGPAAEPARTESDPRVGDLVKLVTNLDERLGALEEVRATTGAAAVPVEGANAVTDAPILAAAPDSTGAPDAIEERVRKVIAEDQKSRREIIGRRFADQAEAREKALLDGLTEDQALTPYQREEMERILSRRRQAVGEFFRTMFTPGRAEGTPDFATMSKKLADVRSESDAELKTLLSPAQYEAFVERDPQQRMGPMGFGGPRGTRDR